LNIFYAPPSQIHGRLIELRGREAAHASKVLRYRKGDPIVIVDGMGNRFEGKIHDIARNYVRVLMVGGATPRENRPAVRLAAGIIKKQDRLEFIVEKAVELGVREIIFFRSENSVKQNLRPDRLRSIAVTAMKQSLRAWLPEIQVFDSLEEVLAHYSTCNFIVARQSADHPFATVRKPPHNPFLFVGPEGGFSKNELSTFQRTKADFISLGESRLRTETAALAMLAQFHFCCARFTR
jgi:16S rRNA (uracil1498-N3)-methyltransferase